MNTRSKTKELIEFGEICCNCLSTIEKDFYAAWCQANEVLCSKCFAPNECMECKTAIDVVRKVYVLDGMPELLPLCSTCYKKETEGFYK